MRVVLLRGASRAIALYATAIVMLGCTRPAAVYRSPAEVVAAGNDVPLELRLVTGEQYTIRDGRIQSDTLYAVALGRTTAENRSLAVPTSAIATLARMERSVSVADAAKFSLAAVTIAAVVAAVGLLALASSFQ
jgi:hypothetical protein